MVSEAEIKEATKHLPGQERGRVKAALEAAERVRRQLIKEDK
jgi:hypothetical protein